MTDVITEEVEVLVGATIRQAILIRDHDEDTLELQLTDGRTVVLTASAIQNSGLMTVEVKR